MKVLFLNNYQMASAQKHWQQGKYPAHHLWGVAGLPSRGINVEILPYERFGPINRHWRIQKALGMDQGQMIALDQQLRSLARARFDVLYSACQSHTFLLSWLRKRHLFSKPIIATVHHPVSADQAERLGLSSHDRLLCLSKKVRESLIATANLPPDKLLKIDWGPDLAFYDTAYRCHRSPKAARRPLIVSAGKADRDHDTLVRATTLIDCTVKIFCSENSKPAGQIDESRVIITSGPGNHNAISYGDLLGEYEAANVIGIPLTHVEELAGLTSLLDAMAMAKPVIMTRNPYIDIDIEKQGIGIWVDVGDVEGWATAISELISKPALAREMGLRGRALCEKQYNLERFTDELASAIAEAVS